MLKKKITAWAYFNRSIKNLNFQYLHFISDANKISIIVDKKIGLLASFWKLMDPEKNHFFIFNKTAIYTS